MQDAMITFRSVTAAMQGAQLLRAAGIGAVTVRTPQALRRRGCGYSLRLQGDRLPAALQTLSERQAAFQGAYLRAPGGDWKEAAK